LLSVIIFCYQFILHCALIFVYCTLWFGKPPGQLKQLAYFKPSQGKYGSKFLDCQGRSSGVIVKFGAFNKHLVSKQNFSDSRTLKFLFWGRCKN